MMLYGSKACASSLRCCQEADHAGQAVMSRPVLLGALHMTRCTLLTMAHYIQQQAQQVPWRSPAACCGSPLAVFVPERLDCRICVQEHASLHACKMQSAVKQRAVQINVASILRLIWNVRHKLNGNVLLDT